MAFLSIDIGGTNTLLGAGNGDFKVTSKVKSRRFLENVETVIGEVLDQAGYQRTDIDEVAVAAAGPIDRKRGVFYPPNFFPDIGVKEVPLREKLDDLGELFMVNDCTSAVLGEYHYGEKDAENMVYITISSGIGAGVVVDGNVLEGWQGNLGEIGHMKLGDQMRCGCGGTGHWEAYCSGNNLPRMAAKIFDAEYGNAREIFDAYEKGKEKAAKVIEKMQSLNAQGIGNLINFYNPEKILVGGAVALNHPDIVVNPIEEKVEKESINEVPEISQCSLKEHSVIHGLRAVCNGKYKQRKL